MGKAWSYSALKSYETCPKRHYHLKVAKDVVEPPSEHLDWGRQVHRAFEERVRDGVVLPTGMKQWEAMLAAYDKVPGERLAEQQYAVDSAFKPAAYFARDVFIRGQLDFIIVAPQKTGALYADWKTGKEGEQDEEQLALSAFLLMCHHKTVQTVYATLVYLQRPPGQRDRLHTYTRAGLAGIYTRFHDRVRAYQRAHDANDFPARPSGLCRRHCPVRTCMHNGANER